MMPLMMHARQPGKSVDSLLQLILLAIRHPGTKYIAAQGVNPQVHNRISILRNLLRSFGLLSRVNLVHNKHTNCWHLIADEASTIPMSSTNTTPGVTTMFEGTTPATKLKDGATLRRIRQELLDFSEQLEEFKRARGNLTKISALAPHNRVAGFVADAINRIESMLGGESIPSTTVEVPHHMTTAYPYLIDCFQRAGFNVEKSHAPYSIQVTL